MQSRRVLFSKHLNCLFEPTRRLFSEKNTLLYGLTYLFCITGNSPLNYRTKDRNWGCISQKQTIFVKIPCKKPLIRPSCGRDRFVSDCAHHQSFQEVSRLARSEKRSSFTPRFTVLFCFRDSGLPLPQAEYRDQASGHRGSLRRP
jgi:hypothetical protein